MVRNASCPLKSKPDLMDGWNLRALLRQIRVEKIASFFFFLFCSLIRSFFNTIYPLCSYFALLSVESSKGMVCKISCG